MEEGVIKFNMEHKLEDLSTLLEASSYLEKFENLNLVRAKLHAIDMVGLLENGISFGNVSVRLPYLESNNFLITACGTGEKEVLSLKDYALVQSYAIEKNQIISCGLKKASSESLSHAAIYEANQEVNAVIHVHNAPLFQKLCQDKESCISEKIEYGSPELAYALQELARKSEQGIVATKGHLDGVFLWAITIGEAFILLENYTKDMK